MCLAVPGKVIAIDRNADPIMGDVDFAGASRKVCLDWVPEVNIGDYVIVHVGFALNTIDEAEALETLSMLRAMGELEIQGTDDGEEPPNEEKTKKGG